MHIWRKASTLLLILLLSGCAIQSVTEPHRVDPDTEPTPVPTSVAIAKQTYTVERGDVVKEIVLTGQVVPEIELSIPFNMGGEVAEVLVERGDRVNEGDTLALLNSEAIESELFLAESALNVAQAQLTAVQDQVANDRRRAEIALERLLLRRDYLQSLAGDSPTAQQTLDLNLLNLDIELAELSLSELESDINPALQAQVDQAQLRVDELNAMMENAKLVAPFDGVVTRVQVDVGDAVSEVDTAVILSDLNRLVVRAFVNEEDMAEMIEGQEATIALASRPGDLFAATVLSMPPPFGTGETLEENTMLFELGAASDFESGDRVTIELMLAERQDVLWLPAAALREFRGRFFIVLQEGDTQRRVDVDLGLQTDDRAEILDGVAEGDVVVGP